MPISPIYEESKKTVTTDSIMTEIISTSEKQSSLKALQTPQESPGRLLSKVNEEQQKEEVDFFQLKDRKDSTISEG